MERAGEAPPLRAIPAVATEEDHAGGLAGTQPAPDVAGHGRAGEARNGYLADALAERETVDRPKRSLLLERLRARCAGALSAFSVITSPGTEAYTSNEGQHRRRCEGREAPPSRAIGRDSHRRDPPSMLPFSRLAPPRGPR